MNKKLSVIVTVYNVEVYLQECIQSIIQQTYNNLEIIIVDDGSTDKSGEICDKLSNNDNRIKVYHKKNGGLLSARLFGVMKSTSDYVTFVDADDWIDKYMYETLMNSVVYENVDIAMCGIKRYYSSSNIIYDNNLCCGIYRGKLYNDVIITHMMCNGSFGAIGIDPSLCTKIFKKQLIFPLINKSYNKYTHHYGEDASILYPYLLTCSSCVILDKYMYNHRQYNDGIKRYINDSNHESQLLELHKYLKNIFILHSEKRNLLTQLNYYISYQLFLTQNYRLDDEKELLPNFKIYSFPFGDIDKGSNIVICGAGEVGKIFYYQLKKTQYCNRVIWTDNFYNGYYKNEYIYPIRLYDDIDYYVVAIERKKTAEEIIYQLKMLGISDEKIIWSDPFIRIW